MNEIEKAIGRIKRGIALAVDAKDEKAINELSITHDALEKQIPKKAIYKGFYYQCPKCGSYFDGDTIKYCVDCGQAIDRSVKE